MEEVMAHGDTGELAGMTTYRMYVTTPNENDVISAIYGEEAVPLMISTTTSFYQTPGVSVLLGSSINPFFFPFYPNLVYDSWVTIGLEAAPDKMNKNLQPLEILTAIGQTILRPDKTL